MSSIGKCRPKVWAVVNHVFLSLPARTRGQPEERSGRDPPLPGLRSGPGLARLPDSIFVLLAQFIKMQEKLLLSRRHFQETSAPEADEKNSKTVKIVSRLFRRLQLYPPGKLPCTSLRSLAASQLLSTRFGSGDFYIPDDRQTNVQRGDMSAEQPPGDKMHPLAILLPLVEFLLAAANTPHKEPVPLLAPTGPL